MKGVSTIYGGETLHSYIENMWISLLVIFVGMFLIIETIDLTFGSSVELCNVKGSRIISLFRSSWYVTNKFGAVPQFQFQFSSASIRRVVFEIYKPVIDQ